MSKDIDNERFAFCDHEATHHPRQNRPAVNDLAFMLNLIKTDTERRPLFWASSLEHFQAEQPNLWRVFEAVEPMLSDDDPRHLCISFLVSYWSAFKEHQPTLRGVGLKESAKVSSEVAASFTQPVVCLCHFHQRAIMQRVIQGLEAPFDEGFITRRDVNLITSVSVQVIEMLDRATYMPMPDEDIKKEDRAGTDEEQKAVHDKQSDAK